MKLLNKLVKSLRIVSSLFIDTFLISTFKTNHHNHRVIIIRLDAIGDFVLWLSAAQATVTFLKSKGKNITLIANSAWAEWAKELGMFDDVIAIDRNKFENNLLYRYKLGYRIRMLGCSIAVQPTYSREWLLGDAVIRICGAEEKIGSAGDSSNTIKWKKAISDRWYTNLIPARPDLCMELMRNAEFISGLSQTRFPAVVADLRAMSKPRLDSSFASMLESKQKFFVLFPGASRRDRQWPTTHFAEIADRIHQKTGWHGVLCGSHADIQCAQDVCTLSNAPLLNWAGKTSLGQLVAILAESQLLVTNETSGVHIAAACGTPAVCILGGGHYGRFLPYQVEQHDGRPLPRIAVHMMPCFNCNWQCIYRHSTECPAPCVEQVTISQVWAEVTKILKSRTDNPMDD